MKHLLAVAACVIAAGLTACGSAATSSSSKASSSPSSSSTGSSPGSLNACLLFTKANAQTVTGITVQAEAPLNQGTHSECNYDRADSPNHLAVINVTIDSDPHQPDQYAFNVAHPIYTAETVAGVGDKAFYTAENKMLVVLKGNNLLHISITDTGVADPKAADTAAANIVLAGLH